MFKDLSPTRENKGRLALLPEGRFLSLRQALPPGFASEGYFELISEGGHTLEWVWPRDGRTKAGQQTTVDEVRSAGMTGWQRSMPVPRTLSDRGAAAAVGLEFVLLIPNDETQTLFPRFSNFYRHFGYRQTPISLEISTLATGDIRSFLSVGQGTELYRQNREIPA